MAFGSCQCGREEPMAKKDNDKGGDRKESKAFKAQEKKSGKK